MRSRQIKEIYMNPIKHKDKVRQSNDKYMDMLLNMSLEDATEYIAEKIRRARDSNGHR